MPITEKKTKETTLDLVVFSCLEKVAFSNIIYIDDIRYREDAIDSLTNVAAERSQEIENADSVLVHVAWLDVSTWPTTD